MTITAMRAAGTRQVRTDADLVEAARRQEPGAYGELFRRWYDRSYDVALNILRDRDAAADVAQDAFLVGWERLADLREPAAFGGWILRATRNRALNRVTRDRFRGMEQIDAHPEGRALRDLDADPALHAERSDQRRLVWTAVAALGERDTSLLDLHLRHGLGPTEIAEELQVTPNNAKQLLFQLRRKLREAIGAVLLWRDGHPTCADLAMLVAKSGPFDGEVARTIRRHQRDCTRCQREIARQTNPERLFASVPFAVAPLLLKQRAVTALTQAGVPAVPASAVGPAPSVLPGNTGGVSRIPAVTGIGLVTLSIISAIALSPMGSDPHPPTSPVPTARATPYALTGPSTTHSPDPTGFLAPVAGTVPSVSGTVTLPTAPSTPPRTTAAPGTAAPGTVASPTSPGNAIPFCRYAFNSSGGNGQFTGNFTITNISRSGWRGWNGSFALSTTMTVYGSWGAAFRVSGTSVTVTPAAAAAAVPPGSSVVVGLAGSTTSGTPRISGFAIQGHVCQGG